MRSAAAEIQLLGGDGFRKTTSLYLDGGGPQLQTVAYDSFSRRTGGRLSSQVIDRLYSGEHFDSYGGGGSWTEGAKDGP
ncbi:hypothetical protein OROGR_019615 [Orobanche gracilis]